eukprot:TRINITY_DN5518_c0_g1_i2.p2 TRINITY_DN5518_c0_g1~~TRINITY_DN5518_c0_g1_i2.p2  ORF type:complete len:179 (+),score=27.62 TRINITY_DN5518_c0_g1_i2:769-1305(+)
MCLWKARKYIVQICEALNYMHENFVIHRDIKPENILVTHTDSIKIADFGWAVHTQAKAEGPAGTLYYMAPEMIIGEIYSNLVDVWSLGVLIFEMITGELPFKGEKISTLQSEILFCSPDYSNIDPEPKDLIQQTLTKANKRTTIAGVSEHVWLREKRECDGTCGRHGDTDGDKTTDER